MAFPWAVIGLVSLGALVVKGITGGSSSSSSSAAKTAPKTAPKTTPKPDVGKPPILVNKDKGTRCSPIPDPLHPLQFTVKNQSFGTIARMITGNTTPEQVELMTANPLGPDGLPMKVDYVFADTKGTTDQSDDVIVHQSTPEPPIAGDGKPMVFVGAYPPPGTVLNLPLTWNQYTFMAPDGRGWSSDGDNATYPPCDLPALPTGALGGGGWEVPVSKLPGELAGLIPGLPSYTPKT